MGEEEHPSLSGVLVCPKPELPTPEPALLLMDGTKTKAVLEANRQFLEESREFIAEMEKAREEIQTQLDELRALKKRALELLIKRLET